MPARAQCAIYSANGSSRLGVTDEVPLTPSSGDWVTFPFSTKPVVTSGMQYVLAAWSSDSNDVDFYYGSGSARYFRSDGTYNTWPSAISDQDNTRQYSIYATVQPVWTITASAGTNGGISPSGVVTVNDGSNQTFTITPDPGYHIEDVTVDGVSQGAITSYTFTNVNADHTITASFEADEYALTVAVVGSGTVSKNPDQATYHLGDSVVLTATPSDGWTFAGWSGDVTSTDNPVTVIFNSSVFLTANFIQDEYILAIAVVGSGSVAKDPAQATYHYGDIVQLTATPAPGYSFSAWSGDVTSTDNPISVTITGNTIVSATFTLNQYTLTVVQGEHGTITPGTTTVNYGGSQAFIITPDPGYHIADVLVDGVSVGAVSSYEFTNVDGDHTITAAFGIDQFTITVIQGANGVISPGTTVVDYNSGQVFTITANTGYHITDVLVDGISQGAVTSYEFTDIQADHTITASFAINTYTITVTQSGNGTISPGTTVVNYGSSQGFTITPDVGYHIVDVVVDGISMGEVYYVGFTGIQADHTITASFAINTYNITVTQGGHGIISPGTTVVDHGSNQTFTITPDVGYHIVDVVVDGVSVGAISSYEFTNVQGDHTITASFAVDVLTISASASPGGSISPSGLVSVNYGSNQTFTITPDTGYHIVDVVVDGVSQGAISSYGFTNVIADHTITAIFAVNTYTITVSQDPNGVINPGTTTVNYGANLTFHMIPDPGYHIMDVIVDGVSQGAVTSWTFADIQADHTITAVFEVNTYTITVIQSSNGAIDPGTTAVAHAGTQAFTIIPDTGYHIADVTVDGVSQGAITSYTFTNVNADHTITASFEADEYALTVAVVGSGSVSKSGLGSYHYGDTVELTATPSAGWSFAGWSGDITDSDNPVIFIINDSMSVTATFTQNTYSLTVNTVGGGSVILSSLGPYYYGDTVDLTAVADAGWTFSAWSGDLTGADNPITAIINGSTSVTATFVQNEYTLTVNIVGNGSVSEIPSQATYHYGDSVQLTAVAEDGWGFSTWSGDLSGSDNPATLVVGEDMTVTATFVQETYSVTVMVDGSGSVSLSNPGPYYYGNTIDLTAIADAGWIFSGWSGDLTGSDNPGTITIDGDKTITATFVQDEYTLAVSTIGNGAVSTNITQPTCHHGEVVQLIAIPGTGCSFSGWSGDFTSMDNPVSITVTCDMAVTATFTINQYTLTVVQGEHGTITPGTTTVNYGGSQAFIITPDPGYHIADVLVDGVSVEAVSSYEFTNVDGDHTITAAFTETPLSDTTPPTICINSPVDGETYCLNEIVIADWWVCDEFGISCSSATAPSGLAIDTCTVGAFTFYVEAMDCAGNYNIVTITYYVEDCSPPPPLDTTPPTIVLTSPADGDTYCLNEAVLAEWTIYDESGIASFSATAPSGSPVDTSAVGTFSFYVEAMDCEGNYNIVTVTYCVEEDPPSDTTPPTIVITVPEDGKAYALNEVVLADWFVTDEGSGVDGSNTWGNVTSGSPIDTMTLGINKFYVYAVDNAGNEASLTVFYNVVESSEIKPGDPDPDPDPDSASDDPTPPPPTYQEPKPSPYVIQTRDNAASILSLLNGTASVNATGSKGLDYNHDGVIDIADAFDQMCSAGILWAPAFKFDPGTARAFFDTLQTTYGPNLENFEPIDGRVWMLYVLTYLPYT